MKVKFFRHISINTNHLLDQYKRSDRESIVAYDFCANLFKKMEKWESVLLLDDFFITPIELSRKMFLVAIMHKSENYPLIKICACRHSLKSKSAWNAINNENPAASSPPAVPFLAAFITDRGFNYYDLLGWAGSFEACLAWGWLQYLAETSSEEEEECNI